MTTIHCALNDVKGGVKVGRVGGGLLSINKSATEYCTARHHP